MLDSRIGLLQCRLRRHQTSVDICAALRLDRRDGAADGIAVGTAQAGRQCPVRGAIESDHANSVVLADPALRPLSDIFALPAWLPFANIFSIGDVLIGIGVAVVIAVAMRRPSASATEGTEATAAI